MAPWLIVEDTIPLQQLPMYIVYKMLSIQSINQMYIATSQTQNDEITKFWAPVELVNKYNNRVHSIFFSRSLPTLRQPFQFVDAEDYKLF